MQTKNDYEKEIFNGTVGFVSEIANEVMAVNFDGILIKYRKSDLDDLTLAYAISIHKSQGSEYPIVVVVLTKDHNVMLQRKLLYTALSRGKEYVIVVGDQEAYEKAVKNDFVKERCTLLCHLLSQ
jgi:exodeoxyribonuclease V alpha subunit